jgi:hypothetical protein
MRDFWLGIAPEHRLPLAAMLLAPLIAWQVRRLTAAHAALLGSRWAVRIRTSWRRTDPPARWAVHLAPSIAAFQATAMGYPGVAAASATVWYAVRAASGRPWRRHAVLVCLLISLWYVVQSARGREELDQVAMTAAVLGLVVLSLAAPRTVTVAVTVLFGAAVWLVDVAHHDHDGIDRLQAGTIRRGDGAPLTDAPGLAERTRERTLRYRDPAAARRGGYSPSGAPEGLEVHYDNKHNQGDGHTLDPDAPEQLVYAVRGGRTLLLGVVYQMPRAGERGPSIAGTPARWHAHNVCVGLLPPGFGVVSPYGGCPGLTLAVTAAEMLHVWVVEPPGGPYTEHLDDAWVTEKLNGSG